MDEDSKTLYVYNQDEYSDAYLHKINFGNDQSQSFWVKSRRREAPHHTLLLINNQLHVFDSGIHRIWNDANKAFDHQNMPKNYFVKDDTFVVPVKQRNCLLILGAWQNISGGVYEIVKWIHSYDLKNKKWSRLNLELPKTVSLIDGTYAVTNDGRFVVIFDGSGSVEWKYEEFPMGTQYYSTQYNDIFVLDTIKLQIERSNVCFPFHKTGYSEIKAIIPCNKTFEELLAFGFVRDTWKRKEFKDVQMLPVALVTLISLFYNNEYLHVIIGSYDDEPRHWKIQTDRILDCYY